MQADLTRADLLQGALLTGGAVMIGGVVLALPDPAGSQQPSPERDTEILNFALLLEYVNEGLYAEALRRASLQGELRDFARRVRGHEQAHIDFIKETLGNEARRKPKLDFGDDTADAERFTDAALKLEDLAVAAYNTQAPNLSDAALAGAARIVSVEARHAAWIRAIAGVNPAPDASEPQIGADRVRRTLQGSGYIS